MSVLEMTKKFSKNFSGKHIIKMNTKTIRELRSIAKDKGLHDFYKLKKADLFALLLEQSCEEMPTPPPRAIGKERRRALSSKIIPSPQEMDEFEREEMKKGRPVVIYRLNKWYDWLVDYVQKSIKNSISKTFTKAKNSILRLYDGAKKTLKDIVEKEAEEEQQQEEDVDLTPHEHERALKEAYRSFMMPGRSKTDVEIDLAKWLKTKKAVINPRNIDEECFKWAVITALHHEDIKHHPERIGLQSFMKTSRIGKDLSFQYRLRRLITLKRRTLA